jgi:RNA polymerase sigma factor (TIGR02999 family)
MEARTTSVTQALEQLASGDTGAVGRLFPLVYDELRAMARRVLRGERADHTLSATALVHEAYLKLVQLDRIGWEGRAHFFGVCAPLMRRILISHARARNADKRGGGADMATLDDALVAAQARPAELVALDEALTRLAEMSPRQARVVECRFFAGMDIEETATALGVSPATVKREWTIARAWLNRELTA